MEIQYSVHVRRLGGVVTKWWVVAVVVILGQETFSLLPMPSDDGAAVALYLANPGGSIVCPYQSTA